MPLWPAFETIMQWQLFQDSLREAIASPTNQRLAQSIFGTARSESIGAMLNTFCQAELGGAIATCGFSYLRVGATFVVQLTTGQQCVVKAYGWDQSKSTLQACLNGQDYFARSGFPCPQVIARPQRVNSTLLAAQEYVPAGHPDEIEPGDLSPTYIRQTMAKALAQLLQFPPPESDLQDIQPWLLAGSEHLWPPPHNVLIDFQQTATGAEWIDAIAQQAKDRLMAGQGNLILGHSDWSFQNMAFVGEELVSVYDWDALRIGQEAWFVGGAARCFNQDWRQGLPTPLITVAEAEAFILEYEAARGRSFSAADLRTIGAALVYTAAYGTRCAHQGHQPETDYARGMKVQLQAFVNFFGN